MATGGISAEVNRDGKLILKIGSEAFVSSHDRLGDLRLALVITRREIRDQFRDWRIIFPMLLLTLIFPWLMNFTASQAVRFVERYNAPLIG